MNIVKNEKDIGVCTDVLKENNLPNHQTKQKNFDLYELMNILSKENKNINILDVGCQGLFGLDLCKALGFNNLYGIDSYKSIRKYLKDWFAGHKKYINIIRGDGTKGEFSDSTFDFIVCISTIEHNIDLRDFFDEMNRITKEGAVLFITADYWDTPLETTPDRIIFNKKSLSKMIEIAKIYGWYTNEKIPNVEDTIINVRGCSYTFISMVFNKGRTKNGKIQK